MNAPVLSAPALGKVAVLMGGRSAERAVSLMSGERRTDISFRMLDSRNNAPVRYERVNAETGDEVPWKDIVKAFEYEKGSFVVLEPEDIRAAASDSRETVEIEAFVILSHTPKGFWIKLPKAFQPSGKRFVLTAANKRYALPTVAEAVESYIARKERQARIYEGKAMRARRCILVVTSSDLVKLTVDIRHLRPYVAPPAEVMEADVEDLPEKRGFDI
jgi:hypothetical protein